MREIKETASVGDSPTLQALAMLAKFYPTVKVVAHDGELGTLDGLENIAQSKLFAHILTLQKLILEIRSLAGLKFRDGKNLLEEVSAKCAETDRLREALEKILTFCELNPEGETDFELAVIAARKAVKLAHGKGKSTSSDMEADRKDK